MDTSNSVVATAGIVVVGTWVQDKPLNVRIVVGGMFVAVFLSLMSQGNPKFASRFATLILVAAAFMYVPAIAYKMGLTDIQPPSWNGRVKVNRKSAGAGHPGRKK
jgi:predicted tellurium resistance membrane protein TerC